MFEGQKQMAFKAALTDFCRTVLSNAFERAVFRGEFGQVLWFEM
jgi:hypothetical protein